VFPSTVTSTIPSPIVTSTVVETVPSIVTFSSTVTVPGPAMHVPVQAPFA
jgi:hypothetical protein